MKRRTFIHQHALGAAALAAAGGITLGSVPAAAQGSFVEGRDYRRLGNPAPVPGHGKIDVVEFFWYGCPHCNALEPALDAWAAKLPADVAFRRMPVVFGALHEAHARMFFALEAMGQLPTVHKRVFAALHVQRRRLDKPEDIIAFVAEQGVDKAKFTEAYNGFGAASKVRQSQQLAQAYALDGVPALGIAGRFLTAGSMAGSNERALQAADFLIAQSRKPA
jgi:thiol:disulfide interchange protein DsbA